jgi:hypothetical protein
MKKFNTSKISESREFNSWLEAQKENPDFDYKITSYHRGRMAEKSKRFFISAVTILILAFNIFFLLSFIL